MKNTLFLCAFRYALGRRSYMVSYIIDILESQLHNILPSEKRLMVKEIDDAIARGESGMACDTDDWICFRNLLLKLY